MKRGYRDFLRLLQFPLIIAMGMMPVPILIFTYLKPVYQPYAWLFPTIYFLVTGLSFLLPGKLRLMYGLAVTVAAVLPWPFTAAGENLVIGLMVTAVFAVLMLWSLRIASWPKDGELHAAWIGACLMIQIVGQVVFFLDGYTAEHPLKAVSGWLYVSFLLTVILCMLCMNRKSLNRIASDRSRAVVSMRVKNVALILGMIVLAVLIALLPSFFGVIKSVGAWISELMQKVEDTTPVETKPVIVPETKPPVIGGFEWNVGIHTDILNLLFQIVFALFVFVGTPLVLIRYGKLIIGFFKNIWGTIMSYAISASEEYEDEVTDTRETVIADESQTTRQKRSGFFYQDRGLSNPQKIRYRYRYLLGKHPQWHKGTTARENLPEELASIYERARYSDHPVTGDEVSRFKSETKNV